MDIVFKQTIVECLNDLTSNAAFVEFPRRKHILPNFTLFDKPTTQQAFIKFLYIRYRSVVENLTTMHIEYYKCKIIEISD